MFSVRQKREIADKIQQILRDTGHPELPNGEIQFNIHVKGAESWSWADIMNNGAVTNPQVNLWNEMQEFDIEQAMSSETVAEMPRANSQDLYRDLLELLDWAIEDGMPIWEVYGVVSAVEKLVETAYKSRAIEGLCGEDEK